MAPDKVARRTIVKRGSGTNKAVKWDAECDTVSVAPAVCSGIFGALERAAASLAAGLVLKRDVMFKLSATNQAVKYGRKRDSLPTLGQTYAVAGDPDVLASTLVPTYFPKPGATAAPDGQVPIVPQALAKQLADIPQTDLSAFDALITVSVPKEGFTFQGGATAPNGYNFDGVLHHEILHALGISSAFGFWHTGDSPLLTTQPIINGTTFTGFAPIQAFDMFLVDAASKSSMASMWGSASDFSMPPNANGSAWADYYHKSPAATSAAQLMNLATMIDRVAFAPPSSSELIVVDTASKPFVNGRSLAHLSTTAHPNTELLLFPSAPRGALPSSIISNSSSGMSTIVLSAGASTMLRSIGWTLCSDQPSVCGTTGDGGSTAAPSSNSGLPVWAIAVIAAVGSALVVGALVAAFVLVRRKHKREAAEKAAAIKADSASSAPLVASAPIQRTTIDPTMSAFVGGGRSLPEGFAVVPTTPGFAPSATPSSALTAQASNASSQQVMLVKQPSNASFRSAGMAAMFAANVGNNASGLPQMVDTHGMSGSSLPSNMRAEVAVAAMMSRQRSFGNGSQFTTASGQSLPSSHSRNASFNNGMLVDEEGYYYGDSTSASAFGQQDSWGSHSRSMSAPNRPQKEKKKRSNAPDMLTLGNTSIPHDIAARMQMESANRSLQMSSASRAVRSSRRPDFAIDMPERVGGPSAMGTPGANVYSPAIMSPGGTTRKSRRNPGFTMDLSGVATPGAVPGQTPGQFSHIGMPMATPGLPLATPGQMYMQMPMQTPGMAPPMQYMSPPLPMQTPGVPMGTTPGGERERKKKSKSSNLAATTPAAAPRPSPLRTGTTGMPYEEAPDYFSIPVEQDPSPVSNAQNPTSR